MKLFYIIRIFIKLLLQIGLVLITIPIFNYLWLFLVEYPGEIESGFLRIPASFLGLICLVYFTSFPFYIFSERKEFKFRCKYRLHILASITVSFLVIPLFFEVVDLKVFQELSNFTNIDGLTTLILYQSLIWINITYIMTGKIFLIQKHFHITGYRLYIPMLLLGTVFFLVLNPFIQQLYSLEIIIFLQVLNTLFLASILFYDFKLEKLLRGEMEKCVLNDEVASNYVYKLFLAQFYINYYNINSFLSPIQKGIGDCSLNLSKMEQYYLDFSFSPIKLKNDKIKNDSFFIDSKKENDFYNHIFYDYFLGKNLY